MVTENLTEQDALDFLQLFEIFFDGAYFSNFLLILKGISVIVHLSGAKKHFA